MQGRVVQLVKETTKDSVQLFSGAHHTVQVRNGTVRPTGRFSTVPIPSVIVSCFHIFPATPS